jgi:hypothetical protein
MRPRSVDAVLPQTDLGALMSGPEGTPESVMLGMWLFERLLGVGGPGISRGSHSRPLRPAQRLWVAVRIVARQRNSIGR